VGGDRGAADDGPGRAARAGGAGVALGPLRAVAPAGPWGPCGPVPPRAIGPLRAGRAGRALWPLRTGRSRRSLGPGAPSGRGPPVPSSDTSALPAGSLELITGEAARLAWPCGVKLMAIGQSAPGAIGPRQPLEPMIQLVGSSPVKVSEEIVSGAAPILPTVTVCSAPIVDWAVVGNGDRKLDNSWSVGGEEIASAAGEARLVMKFGWMFVASMLARLIEESFRLVQYRCAPSAAIRRGVAASAVMKFGLKLDPSVAARPTRWRRCRPGWRARSQRTLSRRCTARRRRGPRPRRWPTAG